MRGLFASLVVLSFCAAAQADFFSNFEFPAYNGSAGGTLLPGQQSWYTPVTTPLSNPANVHTYAGNTLGVAPNPTGGLQFVGGICGPAGELGRAQLDHNFGTRDLWRISFDRVVNNLPGMTVLDNIGSFSTQPSGAASRFLQTLYTWVDPLNPAAGYRSRNLWFNAAGVQVTATDPLSIPGPAWDNLVVNRWYRETIEFDFATNLITSVSITDLTTSVTTTVNPTGWYMGGGAAPTMPRPSAIRLFTGGGAGTSPNGNVMGWDNISIVPEPATMLVLGAGFLAALARRRTR